MNRLDQLARVSIQVFWASAFAALGAWTQSYLDRPAANPDAYLIDDNVDRSGAVFVGYDSGSDVFTIADGDDYGSDTDVLPAVYDVRFESDDVLEMAVVHADGSIEFAPGYGCEDALRSIANRP